MTSEEFEKKMENLKKPDTSAVQAPKEIKLAILSASRSARLTLWFVVAPVLFIGAAMLKYLLGINLAVTDGIIEFFATIDDNPATFWLGPFLLLGLPLAAVLLNLLAITHFSYDQSARLIHFSFKLRWFNLVILAASGFAMGILLLYLLGENCH